MEEEKRLVPNGGYPMHSFQDLRARYFLYIHDEEGRALIEKAYRLAERKHRGVFRRTGEPYVQHPIEVAYILAELKFGPPTLAAALLHDTVEDTDLTVEDVRKEFGEEVALIVDSLTKIQRMKLSHRTSQDFEAEDHRKIFLGMARDVRVILVKLADRLHNLRTLDALSPERQKAIAEETLEVYTPIAHRLGIYQMQSEMEDLSLKYLEPQKYQEILALLNKKEEDRQGSLLALKKRIADILYARGIPFRIESRVKSIYSIYRKMYQKGHSFEEIYDVLAVRIICREEMECYEILGIIHQTYKPIPGRFKDYIAMPKPNMYQSLHTTIVAGDGNIYEVQIRTEEMDEVAEEGIAAHWRYKEGEGARSAREEQRDIEEKLHWFRDFVSMAGEEESESAKEYVQGLSHDIFNANVYVFTPMGKVIELPTGGTVLDFAYKIHTHVGDTAVGASVNGANVPLSAELRTGDVCEIRTAKNAPGPSSDWLDIVRTSGAKTHIRRYLQKKAGAEIPPEEAERRGKEQLLEAFRQVDVGEQEMERLLGDERVLQRWNVRSLSELYQRVNLKNPAPFQVVSALHLRKKRDFRLEKPLPPGSSPVEVEGASNVLSQLAHCCTPVPGDEIVGYVSKGRGVSVHRKDCPNLRGGESRLVGVSWRAVEGKESFPASCRVYAQDRESLIADILALLQSRGTKVSSLRANLVPRTGNVVLTLLLYVRDKDALEDTFRALRSVKGVYDANRYTH